MRLPRESFNPHLFPRSSTCGGRTPGWRLLEVWRAVVRVLGRGEPGELAEVAETELLQHFGVRGEERDEIVAPGRAVDRVLRRDRLRDAARFRNGGCAETTTGASTEARPRQIRAAVCFVIVATSYAGAAVGVRRSGT